MRVSGRGRLGKRRRLEDQKLVNASGRTASAAARLTIRSLRGRLGRST